MKNKFEVNKEELEEFRINSFPILENKVIVRGGYMSGKSLLICGLLVFFFLLIFIFM